MKRNLNVNILGLGIMVLISINLAWAFDIAIYNDPQSVVNAGIARSHRYGGDCDSLTIISRVSAPHLHNVLGWYQQMGVDYWMASFNDPSDYAAVRSAGADEVEAQS